MVAPPSDDPAMTRTMMMMDIRLGCRDRPPTSESADVNRRFPVARGLQAAVVLTAFLFFFLLQLPSSFLYYFINIRSVTSPVDHCSVVRRAPQIDRARPVDYIAVTLSSCAKTVCTTC